MIVAINNHGQFALSLGKESLYVFSKFNPLLKYGDPSNTDTLISMNPSVSVSTKFDLHFAPSCIPRFLMLFKGASITLQIFALCD